MFRMRNWSVERETAHTGRRLAARWNLDDTRWLKPVAHVWTRSAQPWFSIPQGVKAFDTQPEDPAELVRLWHEANPTE
jgi:hypothetical protein